jgi:DNA end-binding protein Ku
LYKAARHERVRLHDVYNPEGIAAGENAAAETPAFGNVHPFPGPASQKTASPEQVGRVHYARVGESPDVHLSREDLLKGYEIGPNQYVVLRPSEVAALRPRTSTELAITEFVKLSEIDPTYFDASYYVAPDRGGEKPYALLYRALADSGQVAIGNFAMHGREFAAIIRAGKSCLVLHTLYHFNEVGREEEVAVDLSLVSEKEVELAKMLVAAMTAPFDPTKLKDKFQEQILELIENRAFAAVPGSQTEPVAPKLAPVVGIEEALRKSLDAVRKPSGKEVSGRGPGSKDKRRRK